MTELSSSGGGRSITIIPDDTSVSLAQAIYHHVTTKTERILETFFDAYTITDDDIIQLCHKLKQAAQRHHEGEWSCVIDHALYKRSRTRHSSLERYKASDKTQAEPTSEIVVVYDFLATNPFTPSQHELTPERYKIVVRASQEQSLISVDDDDAQPRIMRRLVQVPSLNVSVQYVDYTIARALLATVREWIDALETRKRSAFSKFTTRNEFSFEAVLPAVFSASVLLGAAGIAGAVPTVGWQFAFGVFSLSSLLGGLGYVVADTVIGSLYTLQPPTMLRITRGDETHLKNIEKKRAKSWKILGFLGLTIILSVMLNLLSSFIYDWIK